MNTCIKAFKWNESELIGNKTVKQLLRQDVDIKSQKVNLNKLWPYYSADKESPLKDYIEKLKVLSKETIVCLLDIALDYLQYPDVANYI